MSISPFSAQRERSSTDVARDVDSNVSKRAVFDSPEAKSILSYLTGQATSGQASNDMNLSSQAFQKQAGGEMNPYVEDIAKANTQEANKMFGNNLAKVRAQGYRGGTGASIDAQSRLGSDFANTLAGTNSNLRYGAHNDAQNRSLSAAQGLGALGTQGQNFASALLALLRGEDSAGEERTVGKESGTRSMTASGLSCWVARAVYGTDTSAWLLFREWMLTASPGWFRALYLRHGERFSLWLSGKTYLKSVIRNWMTARVIKHFNLS